MGTQFADQARFAVDHQFSRLFHSADGFAACWLTGRHSKPCRGGVYFWVAADGQAYVGQAKSFHARLRAHLQKHQDVRYAFFRPVAKSERGAIERSLIRAADQLFKVRNIKHAAYGVTRVPFDDVVGPGERTIFLNGGALPSQHDRREVSEFARRKAIEFERFRDEPDFDSVCSALGLFLSRVIPRPLETEASFWSVTLKPKYHLLRLNAGQQEVLTISRRRDRIGAHVFTAEPVSRMCEGPVYETDSYVSCVPLAKLSAWLRGPRLQSARELVVGLMRQSNAINYKSHCPQLVEAALRLSEA